MVEHSGTGTTTKDCISVLVVAEQAVGALRGVAGDEALAAGGSHHSAAPASISKSEHAESPHSRTLFL